MSRRNDMELELTKQTVASMLREDTGRSCLDSGGTPVYANDGTYIGSSEGYGRGFERNGRRNFGAEPEGRYHVDTHGGVEVTKSLYWYLVNRLAYSPAWDDLYHDWLDKDSANYDAEVNWENGVVSKGRYDTHYMEDMSDFLAWLVAEGCEISVGPNGETPLVKGKRGHEGVADDASQAISYTYNGENLLDQDVQFLSFWVGEIPEGWSSVPFPTGNIVLLQAHNGADARGGMSAPKIFEALEEAFGYDTADAMLYCKNLHSWSTDDGYHWYPHNDEPGLFKKDDPRWPVNMADLSEELLAEVNAYFDTHPVEVIPPEQINLFDDAGYVDPTVIRILRDIDYFVLVAHDRVFDTDKNEFYCPVCAAKMEVM